MVAIKDCRCIDGDDKHELAKAILTRINVYRKSIEDEEAELIIEKAKTLKKGEIEIGKSAKIVQYEDIIERLEDLYDRLIDTPECK